MCGGGWSYISSVQWGFWLAPKNISRQGSAVNCTIIWKKNFPKSKATRNHSNNRAHVLWHSLLSVSLSSITNSSHNDFINRSLFGQTWSNDHFCTVLCGDHSMRAATTAQVTVQDIGPLLRGESFIFLYINTLFPTLKQLLCTDMAFQIAAEMVSSPDSSSDLCCRYASQHLLPNSPQWTNCSKLSFPSLHNTLLVMRKCDPGCWLIAVLSHALPHRVVKS